MQIKWTRSEQIPASRLIEHCQATLEWTDFLWLNAFSSAQYYGGLFEMKKFFWFFFQFFRYTLPLKNVSVGHLQQHIGHSTRVPF